ncbi:MAG: bacteriohemerythrin [Spirochaetota bacterium]
MDFISWNEAMSVGVERFDSEHRQLVDMVNILNHALTVGAAQKVMIDTLDRLVKYTVIHFKHEEEYMALYDYPQIENHKKEHAVLTSKVAEFQERLESGKGSFSLELMVFLRDWLVNHILGTDMIYKEFFRSKGV